MKRSKSRSIFVGFLSVAVFLGVLSNLIIQDVYACPTDNICLDDCTGELIFVSADSDCPPGSHPDTDGWAAPSMGFSSGSPEYNSIEGAYQITIAVSGGRRNSSTIMFLCSQETTDATHKCPIGYGDGMNRNTFVTNNPINRQDPRGEKTIVVAFSGLDIPFGPPGSKWISQWGPTAKTAGLNVDYTQYTWEQVTKAFQDHEEDLKAEFPAPPEMTGTMSHYGCVRNTIVVLGHSFGGDAAYRFVKLLKSKRLMVDEVVTADPRHWPGLPPFDTTPYDEQSNVYFWSNYYQTQQVFPIELFGAKVNGALNVHEKMLNWDAFSRAHYELPHAPDVLFAVKLAVIAAGQYGHSRDFIP